MTRRPKLRVLLALFAALLLVGSPVASALTQDDVINMSNIGVADSVIISAIEASDTIFELTPQQIIELTRAGVSQTVIEALQKKAAAQENGGATDPYTPSHTSPSAGGTQRSPSTPATRAPTRATPQPSRQPTRNRVVAPTQVRPLPADVKQLKRRYETGKYASAAAMAFDLLTGPNKDRYADVRTTIYYYFGKSLFKLGLYHSAHELFLTVAREGPGGPHFNGCLSLLTRTSDILMEYQGFTRVLKGTSREDLPRRVRSTLLYLIGQSRYQNGDFGDARRALDGVSINSGYYARAQFLQGTAMYQQGDRRQSVHTFRALVEADELVGEPEEIKNIKDLSLLNMARIYYRVEDFQRASALYELVPRDSNYWPQALYEAAYSKFWQGDYNVALGQLLTIDSPFFRNRYYLPEAQLLQGLIYFNLCEYEQVLELVDAFKEHYTPLRDSIRGFVETHERVLDGNFDQFNADGQAMRMGYQAYAAFFDKGKGQRGPNLPPEILTALYRKQEFRNIHHHLEMVRKELEMVNDGKARWKGTPLGKTLAKKLKRDAGQLRAHAGRYLMEQLNTLQKELSGLLGQADIIRFEVLTAQKEEFEDRFRNPEHIETYEQLAQSYATESRFIYWPFTGEYWKDELGYYRFTERGACRAQTK